LVALKALTWVIAGDSVVKVTVPADGRWMGPRGFPDAEGAGVGERSGNKVAPSKQSRYAIS